MEKSVKNNSRRSAKESFFFEGLEKPTGTIFPDTLLDKVMPFLTPAEWKTCSYIIRRTFGWKKEEDNISLDQICNGISRRDGTKLDYGTQMDKKTVIRALKGLESKGVITAKRNYSARRGFEANTYSLRFKGQPSTSTLVSKSHIDKEEVAPKLHKLKVEELDHKANSVQPKILVEQSHKQTKDEQKTKTHKRTKQDSYPSVWTLVLDELQRQVPKHSFDTWLRKSYLVDAGEKELVIAVPTDTERDWVEKRFGLLVKRVAQRVRGEEVLVKFVARNAELAPEEEAPANTMVL